MWSSDSDHELAAAAGDDSSSTTTSCTASPPPSPPPAALRSRRHRRHLKKKLSAPPREEEDETEASPEPEAEDVWRGAQWEAAWPGRWHQPKKPVVLAEEDAGDGGVGRSRSLTDDDLEELKGCADLGFGFSYDEIPELRGTLPALELCYSMTQRLLDHDDPTQAQTEAAADATPAAAAPVPVTNWKISSPGDSPDVVKARLKYWAQAVACTVRLCS